MNDLEKVDPDISRLIQAEQDRQTGTLGLIASENHVSPAVAEAMGTVLTDKYAEGYPGKRWYCGNLHVDEIEQLAIDRAKELFGMDHAHVQPHSGTNANLAVYLAALRPGMKIMAMSLAHGGHLSHGKDVNLSGIFYEIVSYGVRKDTETLDFDQIRELARKESPDLLVVGASAYPRIIDFSLFKEIADEVGCPIMSDIAHIAGLIAGKVHPDCVPYSEFVTATTHKTLRGPRGGLILCHKDWARKIDSAIFPGMQGGPLMHVIAAKAVAMKEALQPRFKDYAAAIVANAKTLAEELIVRGWRLVSGGTDNHLMLVDVRSKTPDLTGDVAADWLEQAGIIANKNSIPFDPLPPAKPSGIRFGTPALTTRGMGKAQMKQLAGWIDDILSRGGDADTIARVRGGVGELCREFPLANGK